jgi:hypothetical protein
VEVVREAVAEKKVIMMDDTPSNFITSKYNRKEQLCVPHAKAIPNCC